jgi:hypothetical protein
VLPLKAELRAKYNETAAYEWFRTVEFLPYGYHNFLFSWIDTKDANFPPVLDPDFATVAFTILEKVAPGVVSMFVGEAFNKRLGTKDLKIAEIATEAGR